MPKENATVLRLSDGTKNLLTRMHFPEIPENATYVAFFDDGRAQFFEDLSLPKFGATPLFVSMYTDVILEF